MSQNKRTWTSLYRGFFWTGVAMTAACLTLVFAHNTQIVTKLEHSTAFPLSWAFAAAAFFQFVMAEICHHSDAHRRNTREAAKRQAASTPQVVTPQTVHFPVLR